MRIKKKEFYMSIGGAKPWQRGVKHAPVVICQIHKTGHKEDEACWKCTQEFVSKGGEK